MKNYIGHLNGNTDGSRLKYSPEILSSLRIKDYLIEKDPVRSDEIKSMFLGKCINDLVTDTKIKECAKRAVWLGNDQTHYIKK